MRAILNSHFDLLIVHRDFKIGLVFSVIFIAKVCGIVSSLVMMMDLCCSDQLVAILSILVYSAVAFKSADERFFIRLRLLGLESVSDHLNRV